MSDRVVDGILGLCVGDALGVPVEFYPRDLLDRHPVTDMRGYGTHAQPAGTWSDDTSMALCLVDALCAPLDCDRIMRNFLDWVDEARYTPHGSIFDIGITCREAIFRYANGTAPLLCGGRSEQSNGNGSLMRILPLAYHLRATYGAGFAERDEAMSTIHDVSALTHAHPRSRMACGIYLCIADALLEGMAIGDAIAAGVRRARGYYERADAFAAEKGHYDRIWSGEIVHATRDSLRSGGYVVDTLEAAIWCLATTDGYAECALRAVNLGDDTDTVAAVAGGLAGICYGRDAIPATWVAAIARLDDILGMCERFQGGIEAIAARSADC